MAENSDTDSDSQGSALANAEDISYPAFTSSSDSSERKSVSQIIQYLLHQPLAPFRYEEIESASSTLVYFIDNISSRLKNDTDVEEVLNTFALLGMPITLVAKKKKRFNPYLIVKPAFLNKLFEYRSFYQDAVSQTNTKSLHSTLVTWVDVVLASLSFATIAVAAAASEVQLDQGVSETILLQKRHDSIRAATQLPGKAPLRRKNMANVIYAQINGINWPR